MREILPELYQDDGRTRGYDVAKLPIYIIALVKEQQKHLENQQRLLETQQQKIDELESKIMEFGGKNKSLSLDSHR